jgi:deoxyadenosine/deoxycytidine kinase
MNSHIKIISIEGNIGSGKSTLVNKLKKEYSDNTKIVFLDEPVSEWENIKDENGDNMIKKYYSDQKRYAYSFQMMAFITRLKQLQEVIEKYSQNNHNNQYSQNEEIIIITERSIFTDREIFANLLFEKNDIEFIEYQIYVKWFNYFVKDIKISKIIYLRVDPVTCLERIASRNRLGENIKLEYLQELHKYHESWLNNINVPVLKELTNLHEFINN